MLRNENDLKALILEDDWMMEILRVAKTLDLPDWWICAGFVRSKVWDELHEYGKRTPLPDVDVIFYDSMNCNELIEKELEITLKSMRPDIPWSVKNQARMHLVNNNLPYQSSEDAISKFPETATALGVKLDDDGHVLLLAPHGLQDVIKMEIKPTPHFLQSKERLLFYTERVNNKKWHETWPKVDSERIGRLNKIYFRL